MSQANAAAGLGTSVGGHLWLPAQLFGRRPAKAPSVGWRQVASWAASTFWHGLKEHLVPLCRPTTEGQRMCLLPAAWWPKFSSPNGPALTKTEKNPSFFLKTYPKANPGIIQLQCVETGQRGHLACLEMVRGAVRQEQALWFKTGRCRGEGAFVLCLAANYQCRRCPSSKVSDLPTDSNYMLRNHFGPPLAILSPDVGIFRATTTTYGDRSPKFSLFLTSEVPLKFLGPLLPRKEDSSPLGW